MNKHPEDYRSEKFSFRQKQGDNEYYDVYKNNIRCGVLDAPCAEYTFSSDTRLTNTELKDLAEASEYLLSFFE